jgi:hypothetical protein
MPEIPETPLGRLRKAVIAQKTASLPDPPQNPLLQPIYDLLYEYDQFTTESVISVLEGKSADVDFPKRKEFDKLTSELENTLNPMTKRDLGLYNNYLDRLDKMMVLVEAVISNRTTKEE